MKGKGGIFVDDNKLIALLLERSETVIAEIEKKYKKQCMRIARNILGNEFDAEECFNDALLKLWNTVPPNNPRSLFAYLSTLTRNTALDRYKYLTAEKRGEAALAFEELENCISAESEEQDDTLADIFNEFLRKEDKLNRQIFLLRYYEANSISATANLLGMPEASVKMRLSRMRKRLEKLLLKKGVLK